MAVVLAFALSCVLAGCGSGANATAPTIVVPTPVAEAEEDFPADAAGARYHPIHHAAFGPIWGSGCPVNGACGCGNATGLAEEFNCQLDHLAANDIPISAYLFDGSAWSRGHSDDANSCTGPDCCNWSLADQVIQRLARDGIRGIVHWWGGCHTPEQYQRASDRLGRNLLGFYLDDGSSDEDLQQVSEFMQSVLPGDWENVAKAYQNRQPSATDAGLSKWSNAAYVGDLPDDLSGLQLAVVRVLSKASSIPAPLAELTGYDYVDSGAPEEAVYYRRLHFGALQPVMAHTPFANSDPWRAQYGPDLVKTYRYWAWLHKELVPYFYGYAERMFEGSSRTVVSQGPMTYSLRVGRQLYVPLVTDATDAMDIELPPGEWINYWDETQVVSGTLAGFPVPLGREPIFIRLGALIPMDVERAYTGHGTPESSGSLTMLVYPGGTSSFSYRRDARTPATTFTSTLAGDALTLVASPGLPDQPVLYRVARWRQEPGSVGVDGAAVTVNQGGDLPRVASEAAVNGSTQNAWYYDAAAQRLIVKVFP